MRKFWWLIVLLAFFLAGCDGPDAAPRAEGYIDGREDVDPVVYTIKGEVVAELRSATSVGASGSSSYYNGYGYSSLNMWQEGKGFLRLRVIEMKPANELAGVGDVIILKTEDRKMIALLAGDKLIMKCRVDHEVLSPVLTNETFSTEKQVAEFDNCRMATPVINIGG